MKNFLKVAILKKFLKKYCLNYYLIKANFLKNFLNKKN